VDALYAGLALLVVLIPVARFRALGGAGLGFALLGAASDRVGGPSAGATFATVNEVLVGVGAGLVMLGLLLGARRRPAAPEPAIPAPPSGRYPDSLLLAGLALAAAAPYLLLVELGILLVLVAAVRTTLRARRPWWLSVLFASAVLLALAFVLALTILGPEAGRMLALRDGPFSPAAERMLVMLLGAGTLLLAGLPPLHQAPWGLGLAPLTAIVMVRVALPALAGGVGEWQPLAMLLVAGAGAAAAFARRWPAFAVAAGLASLWSGVPAGALAAQILVLWGWLLQLAAEGRLGRTPRLGERWAGLALLVPALAALPALEAGLRAQVVLSVALVVAGLAALLREFLRRPGVVHAPLY
jgi:hypothetical protein